MNQSHQTEAYSSSSSSMTNAMNKKKKTQHCESGKSDGIVILLMILRYKLIFNIFRSFFKIKNININFRGQ